MGAPENVETRFLFAGVGEWGSSPGMFSLPLDGRRISAALAGHALGAEVQVHEELVSTNTFAEERAREGFPHGMVVLAEGQTGGRGRRENKWLAPAGRDILMSVLLRPPQRLELWPRITTLAALAICRAVASFRGLRPMIKWPNDVYVNDRKVAGILGETFVHGTGPCLVLGMGINVNGEVFPPEIRETATSLLLESGPGAGPLDRNAVVIATLKQLEVLLGRVESGFESCLEEVRELSWLRGRRIVAQSEKGEVRGTVEGLDGDGHLLLREESGALRVLSSAEQVRRVG